MVCLAARSTGLAGGGRHSGLRRCRRRGRWLGLRAVGGLRYVNAPLEVSSILYYDAACLDVSDKFRLFFNVDLVSSIDVTLYRTLNNNFTGL